MSNKLTTFYTPLLAMCGIEVANGYMQYAGFDDPIPLEIDGKPVIFIDERWVNDPAIKNIDKVYFHPLSESSVSSPSEVQHMLRSTAIVRLNTIATKMLMTAVNINHSLGTKEGFKLNAKQASMFSKVGNIDDKFVKFFNSLMEKLNSDENLLWFDIYIKIQGKILDKGYDRLTIISSPLYDELTKEDKDGKVFGVKCRQQDVNNLREILLAIYPKLDSEAGYRAGSSHAIAPSLVSFTTVLADILSDVNKSLTIFGKHANEITGCTTDVIWDENADLSTLRNLFPISDYNIGLQDTEQKRKRREEAEEYDEPKPSKPERGKTTNVVHVDDSPYAEEVKPAKVELNQSQGARMINKATTLAATTSGRTRTTSTWTLEEPTETEDKPRERREERRERDRDYDDRRRDRDRDRYRDDDDYYDRRRRSRYDDGYDDDDYYDRRRNHRDRYRDDDDYYDRRDSRGFRNSFVGSRRRRR